MMGSDERSHVSEERDEGTGAQRSVIESASGTTDPDNSRSGAGAYVVFLVVVGLLLALVTSASGCVGWLVGAVAEGSRGATDEGARLEEAPPDPDLDLDLDDMFSDEPVSRAWHGQGGCHEQG